MLLLPPFHLNPTMKSVWLSINRGENVINNFGAQSWCIGGYSACSKMWLLLYYYFGVNNPWSQRFKILDIWFVELKLWVLKEPHLMQFLILWLKSVINILEFIHVYFEGWPHLTRQSTLSQTRIGRTYGIFKIIQNWKV